MVINIHNVEDEVFRNNEVWKAVPDLSHIRDQWRLSALSPSLRAMGRKCLFDFLRESKRHEKELSDHFGTKVTIDSIGIGSVLNLKFKASEEHFNPGPDDVFSEICLHRSGDEVLVTMWR